MQRLLVAAVCATALVLTACDDPAISTADLPPAAASSTPAPSSAPTSTPSAPIAYRYDVFQLAKALPTTYRGHDLNPQTLIFSPNLTPSLRPDPLAGRKISPEKCRRAVQGLGGTPRHLPTETPAAQGEAMLGPSVAGEVAIVSADIAEVTGAAADGFLAQLPTIDPACATISFADGSGHASVTRRSLPGFGDRSSYLVRTYPRAGKAWTERFLIYRTPRYVVEIVLYGPSTSEAGFLAFARQVRDRAAQNLK